MTASLYPGSDDLGFWRRKLRDPLFVYVIRAEPDPPIKVGLAKDVNLREVSEFLKFVANLGGRMRDAMDVSGDTPDWREFYGEPIWEPEYRKRRHPAPVVTRYVEPEPLLPEEKKRRLHAHWTRPSRKAPFANLG